MRLPAIAFLLMALSAEAAPPYGYEWMNAEPSTQVVQQAGASTASSAGQAWRLSVGYAVRSFEADFQMSAPSIGLIAPYLGGLGDVGFYRGGSGFLDYEDGYVGGSPGSGFPLSNGTAPAYSYPSETLYSGYLITATGERLSEKGTVVFHSTAYDLRSQVSSLQVDGALVGPFVRWQARVADDPWGSLGISASWQNYSGTLKAERLELGHPEQVRYAYTYDTARFGSSIPPFGPSYSVSGVVFDAATVNAVHDLAIGTPGTFRNPRKAITRSEVPEWTAIGSSFLDVRLNEIFLSADVVWKPWRGWEFGLSAGPTLNVVSTTLNSCTAWERNDGLMVRGESTRQSDTQVAVGVGVQGVVRHDLTRDGRAFIEAHAGYKWLDAIAVGGGSSSANLDLSDWEVGLGVGIRLDDWPAGSPWTLKVGASTRTLSFKAGAAGKSALKSLFNRRGGRGDVGFFNGRDTIRYDDGNIQGHGVPGGVVFVGPFDSFTIQSPAQANLHFHVPIPGASGDLRGDVSFHSTGYDEWYESSTLGAIGEDRTSISSSIELNRQLIQTRFIGISLSMGWESMSTSLSVEPSISGQVNARRADHRYSYSYPFLNFVNDLPNADSSYPFTGDGLIASPAYFSGSGGIADTRHKSQSTTTSLIHYYALTSASVDVSMQTLSLATDLAWKPFKRCEVGVSVGPTLNLVHTSTDLSTDWIREDGLLLARLQDHEERTDFKLGLRLLASARYDLTPEGRWFIEARGGYEWMQDIDLSMGLQAATLDATSWQVGGAIGCRLGVKARLPEISDLSLASQRAKPGPKSQRWLDRLLWRTHSIPVRLGR